MQIKESHNDCKSNTINDYFFKTSILNKQSGNLATQKSVHYTIISQNSRSESRLYKCIKYQVQRVWNTILIISSSLLKNTIVVNTVQYYKESNNTHTNVRKHFLKMGGMVDT